MIKAKIIIGGPIEIDKYVNEFLATIKSENVVDVKLTEAMSSICVLVIYES